MKKQILILICTLFLLTLVSAGTMTRTGPTTVNPGSTFIITYIASGVSGSWGASIQDSISGGCTFPSGLNSYKSVMLSEDGTTKSITITAPASGSCSFSGDVQFGTDSPTNLNSLTVNINSGCSPNWQCNSWSSCLNNQQTRTCTDSNNCNDLSGKPSESQSCTCNPNWQCSSWTNCVAGQQSRTCNDLNYCSDISNKPSEIQTCSTQCIPSWSCSNWSSCSNNQQTRTCTDSNNCIDLSGKPLEYQTCSIICSPNWQCSSWDSCSGGSRERTCTDLNHCGTSSGKPDESKDCSSSYHYADDTITIDNWKDNTNINTNMNTPVEENVPIITIQQSNEKTNPITGAAIGVSESSSIFIGLLILGIILLIVLIVIISFRLNSRRR